MLGKMPSIERLKIQSSSKIAYLMQTGFEQSNLFAKNLFDSLISKAVNGETIGYGIVHRETIIGAILCAEQGTTKDKTRVINLHTLYASEYARGDNVLNLLRYAINDLHSMGLAITIYTPTEKLQKFYKRIGFKYMCVYNVKQNLISLMVLTAKSLIHDNKERRMINVGNVEELSDLSSKNTEEMSLKLTRGREIKIRIRESRKKRRLFLGFSYSLIKIVEMNNKNITLIDLVIIIFKIMVVKKAPLVEFSLYGENNKRYQTILKGKKAPYMIATKDGSVMNIEEMGSEICFL